MAASGHATRGAMLPLLLLGACSSGGAAAAPLTVAAADKSLSVTIDAASGAITALSTHGQRHAVAGSATLEGTIALQSSAKAVGDGVLVSQLVCVRAMDVGD